MLGGPTGVPEIHLRYRAKGIHDTGGEDPSGGHQATIVRLASAIERAIDIERRIGTEAEREALCETGQLR